MKKNTNASNTYPRFLKSTEKENVYLLPLTAKSVTHAFWLMLSVSQTTTCSGKVRTLVEKDFAPGRPLYDFLL